MFRANSNTAMKIQQAPKAKETEKALESHQKVDPCQNTSMASWRHYPIQLGLLLILPLTSSVFKIG